MRILVVGATGTLGKNVVNALQTHHAQYGEGTLDILGASRLSSEYVVDCQDDLSVRSLFEKVGIVDAVVSTIGGAKWASASEADLGTYKTTLDGKLLCQLRIALAARNHVSLGGSITLTSGIVGNYVFHGGSPSAIVNIGLDAFVKSASAEFSNLRINTVSPTVLEESASAYASVFPGFQSVSGAVAGAAYVRSVYGAETGQIIKVWG
ncbi:MAG: short chain dehydrogenase [Acidobacteria bacterium]|nr:short chain dehydrogenase [Acidobacteriota bacterium]